MTSLLLRYNYLETDRRERYRQKEWREVLEKGIYINIEESTHTELSFPGRLKCSGVLPKKEVGGRSLFKFSIFLENIGENGPQ